MLADTQRRDRDVLVVGVGHRDDNRIHVGLQQLAVVAEAVWHAELVGQRRQPAGVHVARRRQVRLPYGREGRGVHVPDPAGPDDP